MDGGTMRTVRIGERIVGDEAPTLIVAEAGVNHNGSVDQALHLVEAAAEAGADVVKFQVFRASRFVSEQAPVAEYQRAAGATSQRAMLEALELSDAEFERVTAHCAACGVEFLATPFSIDDITRLDSLGVRALKIASTDLNNVPLLERAVAMGVPLIVSTGAATRDEMQAVVNQLRAWNMVDRLVLLHCVSAYPTPVEAANLRAIATLRDTFGVPCGFSDHTTETTIAGWAVAAGACVLEKHFTLDRGAEGPDHALSLEPDGLRAYIAAAREAERALGSGVLGYVDLEENVRQAARRSVVVSCDVSAGAALTPRMLDVKRPAGGISPTEMERVIGKAIKVDVSADTALTWDMLE